MKKSELTKLIKEEVKNLREASTNLNQFIGELEELLDEFGMDMAHFEAAKDEGIINSSDYKLLDKVYEKMMFYAQQYVHLVKNAHKNAKFAGK